MDKVLICRKPAAVVAGKQWAWECIAIAVPAAATDGERTEGSTMAAAIENEEDHAAADSPRARRVDC